MLHLRSLNISHRLREGIAFSVETYNSALISIKKLPCKFVLRGTQEIEMNNSYSLRETSNDIDSLTTFLNVNVPKNLPHLKDE